VPKERVLSSGWQMRLDAAAPAPPQEAPPDETAPDGQASSLRRTPAGRATQVNGPWQRAQLPPELRRPADAARVQLADPLRERAPQGDRLPERPSRGEQRRPVHA